MGLTLTPAGYSRNGRHMNTGPRPYMIVPKPTFQGFEGWCLPSLVHRAVTTLPKMKAKMAGTVWKVAGLISMPRRYRSTFCSV